MRKKMILLFFGFFGFSSFIFSNVRDVRISLLQTEYSSISEKARISIRGICAANSGSSYSFRLTVKKFPNGASYDLSSPVFVLPNVGSNIQYDFEFPISNLGGQYGKYLIEVVYIDVSNSSRESISTISKSNYFTYNQNSTFNSQLSPVRLISPIDRGSVLTSQPVFQWTQVRSGVGSDRYKIEISTDSSFSRITYTKLGLNQITFQYPLSALDEQLTKLLVGKTYYWRIKSYDNTNRPLGGVDGYSRIFTFTLSDVSLPKVDLKYPKDVETLQKKVDFSWSALGNGVRSYYLSLSSDSKFQDVFWSKTVVYPDVSTIISLHEILLAKNRLNVKQLYWKIECFSANKNKICTSKTATFRLGNFVGSDFIEYENISSTRISLSVTDFFNQNLPDVSFSLVPSETDIQNAENFGELGGSLIDRTNSEGFSSVSVAPGVYNLAVSKDGYQFYFKKDITVRESSLTKVRVKLLPNFGILSGYVKDHITQQPIANAVLRFYGDVRYYEVFTNQDGFYSTQISNGMYSADVYDRVPSHSYAPVHRENIEIVGDIFRSFNFYLERYQTGRIVGVVRKGRLKAPGIGIHATLLTSDNVDAFTISGAEALRNSDAVTNSDGEFFMDDVSLGTFRVFFRPPGVQSSSVSFYKDVVIRSGETTQVVFDLNRIDYKVKGSIYDSSTNTFLEHAQVWFSDAPSYGVIETNRTGKFSIVGYNGTYTLNVYYPGYDIVRQQVVIDGRNLNIPRISLVPAQGEISFNITYSGNVLRDYTVRLEEVNQVGSLIHSSSPITRVMTVSNYASLLSVKGNQYYRFSFEFPNFVRGYDIDPIQMFVNSGSANDITLSLLKDITVTGRVVDSKNGDGLSGVSIAYESTGINFKSVNGGGFRFSITEPPVNVELSFRVSKMGYESRVFHVSSSSLRGLRFSLSESGTFLSNSLLARYEKSIISLKDEYLSFNDSIVDISEENGESICARDTNLILNGSSFYPQFTLNYTSLNSLLSLLRSGEEIDLLEVMSLKKDSQSNLSEAIAEIQLQLGIYQSKHRNLGMFYDSLVDSDLIDTLISNKHDLKMFILNDDSLLEGDRNLLIASLGEFELSQRSNADLKSFYKNLQNDCKFAKKQIKSYLSNYNTSFSDLLGLLSNFAANKALSDVDKALFEVSRLLVSSQNNLDVINRIVSDFVTLYDFLVFDKFSYLQNVIKNILKQDLRLVEERINNLLQLVYNIPEKIGSVDTYIFSNLGSLNADMGFVQVGGSASFLGEISNLQTKFQLVGSITIENDIIGTHEIPLSLTDPIEIDLLEILPENIRSLFAADFEMGSFLSSLGLPSMISAFVNTDGSFEIVSLLLSLVPYLEDLVQDPNWLDNQIREASPELHRFVSVSRNNLNNDLTLFSLSSALTLSNAFSKIRSSEEETRRLLSVSPEEFVESNSVLSFLPGNSNPLGGVTDVISQFGFSLDDIVNLTSSQLLQIVSGSMTFLFDDFDFDFTTLTISHSGIDSLEAVNGFGNAIKNLIPPKFRSYFSTNFSLNGYKNSVISAVNAYIVEFGNQQLITLSQTLSLPYLGNINFTEFDLPKFMSFVTNDNVIQTGLDFFGGDTSTLDGILDSFHSGELFYRFLAKPILLASQIRLPLSGFEASLNNLTLGYHRGLESFEISASLEVYLSDLTLPDLSLATSVSTSSISGISPSLQFLEDKSFSVVPSDLIDLSSVSAIKLSSATPFKLYIGLAGQTLSLSLPQLQADFPGENALNARLMGYNLLIDQINLNLDPNNSFLSISSRFQFDQLEQDIRLDATFSGSNAWALSSGNVILESPITESLSGWDVLLRGGRLDAQGLRMTGSLFLGDVVDRWLDVQGCLQLTPSGETYIACSLPGFIFEIPSLGGKVSVNSVTLGYQNNVRPLCSSEEGTGNSISETFLQAPQIFLNGINLGLSLPSVADIESINLVAETIRLGVCTNLTYSGLLSSASLSNVQVKRYEFAIEGLSADLEFLLGSANVNVLSAEISIDTDSSQYLGISNYRFLLDVAMSFSMEPLLEKSGVASPSSSEFAAFSVARTGIVITNNSIAFPNPFSLRSDQGGISLSINRLEYDQRSGRFSGDGLFILRGSLLDGLSSFDQYDAFSDYTTFSESDDLVVDLDFSSTRSSGVELRASSSGTPSLLGLGTINNLSGMVKYHDSIFSANLNIDVDIALTFGKSIASNLILSGDQLTANLKLNADFDGTSSVIYLNNLILSNKRKNQQIVSISNAYFDLSAMHLEIPAIHIKQPLERIYYLFDSNTEHRLRSVVAAAYTALLAATTGAAVALAPFTFGLSFLAIPAAATMVNFITLKADLGFRLNGSFVALIDVCFDGLSCSRVSGGESFSEDSDPVLYGHIRGTYYNSISDVFASVSLYSSEASTTALATTTVDKDGGYAFLLSEDTTLTNLDLSEFAKTLTNVTSIPLDQNIYVEASLTWPGLVKKSTRIRLPSIKRNRSLDVNLSGEFRDYRVPVKVVGAEAPSVSLSDYQIDVTSALTGERWILNQGEPLLGYRNERLSLTVYSLGYEPSSFDVTLQGDRSFSIKNPFGLELTNLITNLSGESNKVLVTLDFSGYTFSSLLDPIFPTSTNFRYSSYCSYLRASVTPEFSAVTEAPSLLGAFDFNYPLPIIGDVSFASAVSPNGIVVSCENSLLGITGLPKGEHTLAIELPGGSMNTYDLSCPGGVNSADPLACDLVGSTETQYLSPTLTSVAYAVQVIEDDTLLPVPNVTLTVSNDDLSLAKKFRTDSQGRVSLDLLYSVSYNLQVTPEGQEAFEYSFSDIRAIEASAPRSITLEVPSGRSVRFRALSSQTHLPIEGMTVSIDGSSLLGVTNHNGYVDFRLKDSITSVVTNFIGVNGFASKRGYEVSISSESSPEVEVLLNGIDLSCLPSDDFLYSIFSFQFLPVSVTCNTDSTYTASGVILLPTHLGQDVLKNNFINREIYVEDVIFDSRGNYSGSSFSANDARLINLPRFTLRYENSFDLDLVFVSLGLSGLELEVSTILNPDLQQYFGSTNFTVILSSDSNFSYVDTLGLFKPVNRFSTDFLDYSFVEGIGKFYLERGEVLVEGAKIRLNSLASQYMNLPRYSEFLGGALPSFESIETMLSFSGNRKLRYRRVSFSSNSLEILDPVYQIGATSISLSSCVLPSEAHLQIRCTGTGNSLQKTFGSVASIDFYDPVIQISASISELFFRAEVSLMGSSNLKVPMPNFRFSSNVHFILEGEGSVFSSTVSFPNPSNAIDWAYGDYIDIDLDSLYLNINSEGTFVLLPKFDIWSKTSTLSNFRFIEGSLLSTFSSVSMAQNQFAYSVSSDAIFSLQNLSFSLSLLSGVSILFDFTKNLLSSEYGLSILPTYSSNFSLSRAMYSPLEYRMLQYALDKAKEYAMTSAVFSVSSINSEILLGRVPVGSLSSVKEIHSNSVSSTVSFTGIDFVYSKEVGLELRLSTSITSDLSRLSLNSMFPEQLFLDGSDETSIVNLERNLTYTLSN